VNLLLVIWTLVVILAFAFGFAHVFFPDAMARRWGPGLAIDADRRWRMQTRGAIAVGVGFFLCWILVEGGGLLRWMM
jgi:predicted Co/Zn/Cd cation transporter (cation efflux family)